MFLNIVTWYAKPSHLEKEDRIKKKSIGIAPLMPLNLKKMRDVVVNLAEKN